MRTFHVLATKGHQERTFTVQAIDGSFQAVRDAFRALQGTRGWTIYETWDA